MTTPKPSSRSKRDAAENAIVRWLHRSATEQLGIAAKKSLSGVDSRDDTTAAHVMMMLSIAVAEKRYAQPDA